MTLESKGSVTTLVTKSLSKKMDTTNDILECNVLVKYGKMASKSFASYN